MKEIFNDGVLEATFYPSRWIFCRWVNNKHGRLQKSLIRDLNMIEKLIFDEKYHGWFTDSEITHEEFHKLLIKFGCLPREVIGQYKRFVKPILKLGDLHSKAVV